MAMAGDGDEVRKMVTAMECAKWQRQCSALNGDGKGVSQVATAGNGNEVRIKVMAME